MTPSCWSFLAIRVRSERWRGLPTVSAWPPARLTALRGSGTAQHGTELLVLRGHEDAVGGVAWSPDGQRLATASHDRTARVWDTDMTLEALIVKGRKRVLRQLTDEERKVVLLPEVSRAG